MSIAIRLLSDLSYGLGIIGHVEYMERIEIADWLLSGNVGAIDPRIREDTCSSDLPIPENSHPISDNGQNPLGSAGRDDINQVAFLLLGRWHFTLGDPDCVPSVPHGHENSKTQAWPKLNPYTGRIFKAIHVEDSSRRLGRHDMQTIWRNEAFVEHCRTQVQWYADAHKGYQFVNARRGPLLFPRW